MYTFVKRNTKIILTLAEELIFFPSAAFEMYAEVCPAFYVDCISLYPVLVRFLCRAVPQEAMGIFGFWHLQFLASLFIMCRVISWGTPKLKVFESFIKCLISCDSCLLMSVYQKGASQKEQTFQVLVVWVQISFKPMAFSGRGDTLLTYLFSFCSPVIRWRVSTWPTVMLEWMAINSSGGIDSYRHWVRQCSIV